MSTNQSLNPKLKIVAIYNKRRVDQGLSPINVNDYTFSNPIQYAGVKSTKNTRIYLTPNTSSSQFGRITIYYDRIDLSSVIGARVIKHDATTIVELLPSINEELGVELTALDIVDGQLTNNLNFVLRASTNSLVFTGSTSVGYYVDDTALFPAEGTILEAGQCNTVSFYKYNLVADGIGGAREDVLEYNSVECGFSLPTPVITVRADNTDIVLPITAENNILTLIASMSSLHTYIGYELAWLVKYPGSTVFEKFYSEQFFASSETKERVKYLELNTNIPLAVSSVVVRATLTVINNTSIVSSVDKVINLHLTPPTTPTATPSTSVSGTTSISTTTTAAPTTTTTTTTPATTVTTTTTPSTTPTPTPTTSSIGEPGSFKMTDINSVSNISVVNDTPTPGIINIKFEVFGKLPNTLYSFAVRSESPNSVPAGGYVITTDSTGYGAVTKAFNLAGRVTSSSTSIKFTATVEGIPADVTYSVNLTTTTTTPITTPTPTSTSSETGTTTTTTTPSTTPTPTPTPSPVADPTLVSTLANTRTLSLTEASTITALTTGKTLVESYNTSNLSFSVTLSNPTILDQAGVNYTVKVILKSDAVVISNTGVKTTIEPGILHTEGITLVPSSNSKTISFDIGTENAVVGASTAGKALLSYSPVTYLLFGEGIHFVTDFSITTEVYQSSTLVGTTTKTYVLEYLRDKNLTALTTQFNFDNTETLTTNTFVKTNAVVEIPIHLTDRPVSTIKTNAMVQNAVSINTANSLSFYKLLKSLVTFTNFTAFKNEIFNLRIYRTDESNNIMGPSSVMIQEYFYTGNDLFTAEETPKEKLWNVIYDPEVEAGSTHPTYYHLVFTGSLGRKKVTTYVQTLIAQWYVDLRNAFQYPKVSTSLNGATANAQTTIQLPITDQNKNVRVDFTFTNLVVGYSYKYKLIQSREDIASAGSSNFPDEYYKLLLEGTITATATSMPLTRYFAIDPAYIVDSTKVLACNVALLTYSINDTYGTNAFGPNLLTTGTNYINISLNTMTPGSNAISTSSKTRSFDLQMFFIDAQGNVLGLPPDLADNYQLELWSKITDPTNVESRIWHRGRYKGDTNVPIMTITGDNQVFAVDFTGVPNGGYTVAFRLYKKTTKMFIASTAIFAYDNSFFNPISLTYNL